jgi:hypothetical protein
MILVLCKDYHELLHIAANVAQNKILNFGHRAKWTKSSGVMEDLTTGSCWHFVSTDSPENMRCMRGQVYTSIEGEIPNEFWLEMVWSRVRSL